MKKTLTYANWNLVIELEGGRIEELSYKNNVVLGTFPRQDGKTGTTHLCIPNFAEEGTREYGLPFHGPARSSLWQVDHQNDNSLTILCKLPLTDKYRAQLYIAQVFILQKEFFKQEITVEHGEGEPVPVNIGIHNYWATPAGWEEAKLNGEDISEKIRANGYCGLRKSNTLTFPGGIRLRLKTRGFEHAVLWSAKGEAGLDAGYACIEPVREHNPSYFGGKNSLLKEGKSFTASQEISVQASL